MLAIFNLLIRCRIYDEQSSICALKCYINPLNGTLQILVYRIPASTSLGGFAIASNLRLSRPHDPESEPPLRIR